MRVLTVSEMKGRSTSPRNDYPTQGTVGRAIFDRLKEHRGCVVDLTDIVLRLSSDRFGAALERLQSDYGLDIRKIHPRKHDRPYVLAGEWFGAHYSDYVAASYSTSQAPSPLSMQEGA